MDSNFIFQLHSGVRWIVLFAAVVALLINLHALFSKRSASDSLVKNGMRVWTISLDVQWLIGIILLLLIGVFTRVQLEHAFANTLAVVIAHSAVAFRNRPNQTRLLANIATIFLSVALIIIAIALIGG